MDAVRKDVIVIGSGPAGGIVARSCADAGRDVLVVERDGWGGVCPLRGCEPKKVLADVTHTASRVRDLAGNGLKGGVAVEWADLMRFKRSFTEPISDLVRQSMDKRGAATITGNARFAGPDTVDVEGHGRYTADAIVLAVGARPRSLDMPGSGLIAGSDDFLELERRPDSVIFVGGGFISFEFACIAAAAGAQATILHRSSRALKGFDGQLVDTLIEAVREQGVTVLVDHPITGVERDGDGIVITARDAGERGSGEHQRFRAELAVHGAGRVPDLDGIGLESAGVKAATHGVEVDAFMRSVSNPHVFAAGDCVQPGMPLTPTAALQASAVAHNILHGPSRQVDLAGAGSVVFTHPPLSRVGLLEEEAREQGLAFDVFAGDAAKWSEHQRLGIGHAGYRVVVERDSGRMLGAHYLGQHAEEMANIFGLAIRHGLTRDDLLAHPWAYPSFGYALRYMLS